MEGADYLTQFNTGHPPALGRRLVVIGGGSAALDVARSARRAGHDVTIVCLESRAQMPAQREEVVEALEEGVALVDGAMLTAAAESDAGLKLHCVRAQFSPGAGRGQFTVTPLAGTEFTLAADAIVPSIGQDPDLAPLPPLATAGTLLQVDAQQATSGERIYAGGDMASMARFVTEAVGMGKRAALEIDRALRARDDVRCESEPIVPLAHIATAYYLRQPRSAEPHLDAAQRLKSQVEVQLGFDLDAALAETERCFSCGTCIFCDNCVNYCPDLAVKRNDAGDGFIVLKDYCKGCGLCVKECPTGSMKMVEEVR
jgi:NADPH-dependent glutamate synthase beta subunit-like oxidoreductase